MLSLDAVRLPLAHFDLDVTLEVRARSTGIFGPSGSGKTTLLELIAGVRRPTAGRIAIDDVVVEDLTSGVHIPARNRRLGYVPQGDSLFPHMTVEKNIRFGMRDGQTDAFFQRVIEVLEIAPLLPRAVGALSGGEAKRSALARALVASPRLLLLDEPLAGLDRPLHGRVMEFLVRVRDELRIPLVFVSHDFADLQRLVSDAIVLDRGTVIDHGPVDEVCTRR